MSNQDILEITQNFIQMLVVPKKRKRERIITYTNNKKPKTSIFGTSLQEHICGLKKEENVKPMIVTFNY